MQILRRTTLEMIARNEGFDRAPLLKGEWSQVGSSHFGEEVLVKPGVEAGSSIVALLPRDRGGALESVSWAVAGAAMEPAEPGAEPRTVWQVVDDVALAKRLRIVAAEAAKRRNHPLERFAERTAKLPKATEAERLVVVRVGQDIFRDSLLELWQGRCAVTGLAIVPLLRASHAKPWADCAADVERLDPYNGFLLSPNFDALFDQGWITFDDDCALRISPQLDAAARDRLGLDAQRKLSRLEPAHLRYLAYHRKKIFRS